MSFRVPLVLMLAVFGAALFVSGCSDDDDVSSPDSDSFQAIIDEFGLAPLPAIPYPEDNPFLAERVALGQLLFFDPILGGESAPWIKRAAGKDPYTFRENDMACATCHFPTFGFADGRRLGAGVGGAQFNDIDLGPQRVVPAHSLVTGKEVGLVPRNSPSCMNVAFNGDAAGAPSAESVQFLDGRVVKGLEAQAKFPITSRDEMAGDAYELPPGLTLLQTQTAIQDSVVNRLRNIEEYVTRFKQAFAGDVEAPEDITLDHMTRAIAAFERELITPDSRFDRFVAGDRSVFTEQEADGFELFFGKGLCGDCHSGPMLSDFSFTVQGVADDYESIIPGFRGKSGDGHDFGRFHADPVAFADQKYAFRTLTIRNVEVTAPYFHSGSAGTLREVVEFYNRGGRGPQDIPQSVFDALGIERHESITPLGLTDAEMDAMVAFMKTTTAALQAGPLGVDLGSVPTRVPSGLLPPGVPTPKGESGPFLMEKGVLP